MSKYFDWDETSPIQPGSFGVAEQVNSLGRATNAALEQLEDDVEPLQEIEQDAAAAKAAAESAADRAETAAANLTTNLLYNPEFEYAERVDLAGNPSSISASGYLFDRWEFTAGNDAIAHSVQAYPIQSVGALPRPSRYARLAMVAGGGTTGASLRQKIPDARSHTGVQLTFSGLIRSSVVGTQFQLAAYQLFGTGGTPSPANIFAAEQFTISSIAFEEFSLTFTVPDINDKTLGTNGDSSLVLQLQLLPNQYTVLDAALMALNPGPVRTLFIHQKYGDDLANCRFFYRVSTVSGLAAELATRMYDTPTETPAVTAGHYEYEAEL